jgi:hypothetical protein
MPFPPGPSYGHIGKKYFYIFHSFVFFNFDKGKIKNQNIFGWHQVLTISLLRRCRSAMAREIPMTLVEGTRR